MLSYAVKRIVRSWKLFVALILGMILAGTFFGGINVGADTIGKQALDRQLANTPVDIKLTAGPGFGGPSVTLPASRFQTAVSHVRQVDGVLSAEPRGRTGVSGINVTLGTIAAIPDSSVIYKHLTIISGQKPQASNETLVNTNSPVANNYVLGKILKYQLSPYGPATNTSISLKIVGFANFDTVAAITLGAGVVYDSRGVLVAQSQQSVLIVSWEQTYAKIVDWAYQQSQQGKPVYGVDAYVDVNIDRDRFISPFDIEGSAGRVAQVDARISNVALQDGFTANDFLLPQLASFAPSLISLRLTFIVFSIPVFFMAWYVGRTVSQASYNLRRREIGLLMTKGFSRTQLFRHFLVEALLVGVISGLLGLAAGFALNPYFVQLLSGSYQGGVFLSLGTAIATVIFTLVLTFLAILSPARQASSLDPAQALREYVYVEEVHATRKRGAILAFSLGLYKIILLLLGVNFLTLGRYAFNAGGGVFLIILVGIMSLLDLGLTFIGPFLFLYGATQLSTGLSVRFHKAFSAISRRVVGDIASLASRSVFRNPRRVASLVFLVALIAGYSIWVTGDLASMEDFNVRQAIARVGSDIRLSNIGANASFIAAQLRTWNNNVSGATPETDYQFNIGISQSSIRVKAIDPLTWRDGAYYEREWFSGDINSIFQFMSSQSHSVILDHGVASYYAVSVGNNLTIAQSPAPLSLRVVGLFGPDYSQSSQTGIVVPGISQYFYPQGWSYVPQSLAIQFPSLFSLGSNSTLVKAKPGVSVSDLGKSIQKAYPSASVELAQVNTQDASGLVFSGVLNVLRLGTVFAGAAACIGVGAVTYTGFKEREKETTIIAVRGLSYRQLLGLLVTEVLPLVIFALVLATIVGLITVRGDTLALNSLSPGDYYALLAPRRIVFPYTSQVTLLAITGLLLAGVLLPAIAFARKNLSKMSRTVRFA